jgi:hypothetical protein
LLDASGGKYYYGYGPDEMREAYERAKWELEQHGSFARFREPGKGWRDPDMREELDREWAIEKARRAVK